MNNRCKIVPEIDLKDMRFSIAEAGNLLHVPIAMINFWTGIGALDPQGKTKTKKMSHSYFTREGLADILVLKALVMKAGVRSSRCKDKPKDGSVAYTFQDLEILEILINRSNALRAIDILLKKTFEGK
jgi:hypothetical protein